MVRFNFWDKFFGDKPKSFKKEAEKQIKTNTLNYIKWYGKSKWITVEKLFEETLEKTDLFNSEKGKMLFAIKGIKSAILSKKVTYDFERLMNGAKLLKCSEFGDEVIKNMAE